MTEREQGEAKLIVQLGIVRQLMATREAKLFSKLPLNSSQFGVLNHFTHNPERSWTVTELADVMEMNQPGITKIISVLLEKNLLESISDREDKRRRYLKITSSGLNVAKEILSSLMPDVSHVFSSWQDEELAQMQGNVEKLMRWLDDNRDNFAR
ncbi:MarR family transcriptional regulator [uncultured Vibrio sp.]|uniref:MarR family winged helix-turn-helix transcriptional regulator n=1 Tax=uncultured Vibrio sp. TaxID=114054 RepID=UPI0025D45E5F|nr:MarR family transcriptional regulator [uncultured Vibrio sp.]